MSFSTTATPIFSGASCASPAAGATSQAPSSTVIRTVEYGSISLYSRIKRNRGLRSLFVRLLGRGSLQQPGDVAHLASGPRLPLGVKMQRGTRFRREPSPVVCLGTDQVDH